MQNQYSDPQLLSIDHGLTCYLTLPTAMVLILESALKPPGKLVKLQNTGLTT